LTRRQRMGGPHESAAPTYAHSVKRPSLVVIRQLTGIVLFVLGIGLTALLAFMSGSRRPPSRASDAVLVILIALAQGGAAWAFSGFGRADPTHAQQSALRLFWLAHRAHGAGSRAQSAFENEAPIADLHTALGVIATEFSWMEDGLLLAIEDWRAFHKHAVDEAEGARRPDHE